MRYVAGCPGKHAYKHLQFKPGSDVAMLNAMLHTIITEGLTDQQYIAGYTEGFDELAERIKEFPPEKMEAICGIPAETLKEVARVYARSQSSIIFWGMRGPGPKWREKHLLDRASAG